MPSALVLPGASSVIGGVAGSLFTAVQHLAAAHAGRGAGPGGNRADCAGRQCLWRATHRRRAGDAHRGRRATSLSPSARSPRRAGQASP